MELTTNGFDYKYICFITRMYFIVTGNRTIVELNRGSNRCSVSFTVDQNDYVFPKVVYCEITHIIRIACLTFTIRFVS